MQLSVNLNGVETAAELRTLAAILAAMYGTPWLEPVAAGEITTTIHVDPARVVVIPPTGDEGGEEQPNPAAVFSPPAADVFKPAGEAGNAAGASAPIAAAPVGTPAAPPPAPAASAPSGVELDVDGIPWDGRIHASTKTKNANGKWKGLRGLNDEAKVNAIRAELLAAQAAPRTATPPAAPVPPAPAAAPAAVPVPPAPQPPAAAAGTGTVPPAPGAVPAVPGLPAVAAPVAPSGDAEAVTTFPQIMKKISALRVGQFPRMSAEELQAIMTGVGLASLPSLATRPDLIPEANAQIDALMLTKLQ